MYHRSTLSYIERVQRVMMIEELCPSDENKIYIAMPNFYLVWCSLSYLLLTASTVDDQFVIVGLLQQLLAGSEHGQSDILLIALLPLFQTLAELQDFDGTSTSQQLRAAILDLVSLINHISMSTGDDHNLIIEKWYEISGSMAHMVPYLCQYLDRTYSGQQKSIQVLSTQDSLFSFHSILFYVPLLFSIDESIRLTSLSNIVDLVNRTSGQTSLKFPMLLVFIYLMRHPVATTETLLHILHHSIPSLVSTNDPITTTKILHVALSLTHGTNDSSTLANVLSHTTRETTMSSIGLKVLVKLHDKQPRIWQELRKVLSDWILRRKSNNGRGSSIEIDQTGSTQMEIAILTTMRDLCQTHPRDCAPDILPMLISLLQTCQYVHVASLSIIVQTMCACIRAGMAEPRSLWLVAISYIAQFAMNLPTDQASLLLRRLCEFFNLAGKKDDLSDPYTEFKQVLLDDYLSTLICSSDKSIQTSALQALSSFPTSDILTLLPEKAKEYVDSINDNYINDGHSDILVNLITYELDHMRRGFFQDEQGNISKSTINDDDDDDDNNSSHNKDLLNSREHQIGAEFVAAWENARISPGLRSGYTIAVLQGVAHHLDPIIQADTMETLVKTKWYRCMVTSLGMISTLYEILPSHATTCTTQLIDIITSRYITSGDSKLNSLLVTSEEVQYAARYCLGHVAKCIIINDKMTTQILDTLLTLATQCRPSKRSMDASVDLIHFSSGYAAGHFSSVLATWPTKSSTIETLAGRGISELLDYCNGSPDSLSESTCLGIMMGWASKLDQNDMRDVIIHARKQLELYTNRKSLNVGLLLGAPWICAYGAYDEYGVLDQETVDVLSKAAHIARDDSMLAKQMYHFDVPLSRLFRLQHIADGENESSPNFSQQFLANVEMIQTDDASSSLRIPALFCLGSLLGADYLHSMVEQEQLFKEAQQYNKDIRRPLLDVMTTLAGLTDGLSAGNLKSGRIAAVICGELVQKSRQLQDALNDKHDIQSAGFAQRAVAATSAEPKSYSRLNNNTSYLRAVFDALTQVATVYQHDHKPNDIEPYTKVLLSALRDTIGPLPSVNWYTLLSKLSKISTATRVQCIRFASMHATTSLSLSEYILSELGQASTHYIDGITLVLVGQDGIGKLLELSGLPDQTVVLDTAHRRRGMDAVTKKMTVSDIRAIELFEAYCKLFKQLPMDCQKLFLSTVKNHLPLSTSNTNEAQAKYIISLQDTLRYNITYRLLDDNSSTLDMISLSIQTSINNMDDLLQGSDFKTWMNDASTAYLKVKAIMEVCHLQRTALPIARWMTDVITHLLLLFGESSITQPASQCWDILCDTLMDLTKTTTALSDRFAWVIRLLDVLIVIVSGTMKKEISVRATALAIETIIRQALDVLWSRSLVEHPLQLAQDIALADTAYLLAYSISMAKGLDAQRQIVRRVLKLVDLLSENDDEDSGRIKKMFIQVLRDCPKQAMEDHRDQFQDIIPFT
ncbi:uncharacterized protein BX664DRAFT_376091 [Halteromyces radiatus]|uniref:uncharacterized protein n=1 Tax=Halteromyces radiatus TaxID=101107 RepID=UPI00221E7505|nr:uncharacterized protein BX664DRAFT_376091 [Halteromyces radiatus]KAI8081389.1 hypothetical protein BX664DRAFT_376091 [Halteromyces radiatus]